jgi:hypothetical protein
MSTNYWIEQYNKEVLASEVELHIRKKYGTKCEPIQTEEISREIASYLRKIGKTQYKVYVRMTQQTSGGYTLSIEIP